MNFMDESQVKLPTVITFAKHKFCNTGSIQLLKLDILLFLKFLLHVKQGCSSGKPTFEPTTDEATALGHTGMTHALFNELLRILKKEVLLIKV